MRAEVLEKIDEPFSHRRGLMADRAMSRIVVLGVLLVLSAAMAGCVSVGPTFSREAEKAAGPFPNDYREMVRYWIDTELGDTSSVTDLRVTRPVPGAAKPVWLGKRQYGWFTRVSFKARDSLGASKGRSRYSLLIRDDRVLRSQKELY